MRLLGTPIFKKTRLEPQGECIGTVGGVPILHRYPVFVLMSIIVIAVLGACHDSSISGRDAGSTVTPVAQDGTRQLATATPTFSREERGTGVNRIAYVGSDGNIFTIKPDGTDSRRLTITDLRVGSGGHILAQRLENQVFYTWPTWSPDSTKLAASRVMVDQSSASYSLEVVDASTGEATRIYDNQPNTTSIARGTPHYMYWSPDSKHLAFIASTPQGLVVFVDTPADDRDVTPLMDQGPLYFSWSSDSGSVLIHRGFELFLAYLKGQGPQPPQALGSVSPGFRAPGLSPDGSRMVYALEEDTGDVLYVANTQPPGSSQPGLADARPILDIGPSSAFIWSPTRDEVAVADTTERGVPSYDRLTIVSSDGATQATLVNEPMLAFFWSPDGEKIAYVAYDLELRSFTWKYVNRSGGPPTELAEFQPSSDYLTLILFFDQYAYSHSVWSPDGSQLVFSGTIGSSSFGRNGGTPDTDKVYVLDLEEGSAPREIASSRIAVWSWK